MNKTFLSNLFGELWLYEFDLDNEFISACGEGRVCK
jgi:hypothetical protein